MYESDFHDKCTELLGKAKKQLEQIGRALNLGSEPESFTAAMAAIGCLEIRVAQIKQLVWQGVTT